MEKTLWKRIAADAVLVLIGSVLYAMSMNQFLIPTSIVLGGASGLGVALNSMFGINEAL